MNKEQLLQARENCRKMINDFAIWRKHPLFQGIPAKNSSHRYSWQFYLRRVLYNPEAAYWIGEMFWFDFSKHFDKQHFQIGACEAAGVPLGCAIQSAAYRHGTLLNLFTIKQEPKKYGLMNLTEGCIEKDLPVILVDDLAGSQNTLRKAHSLLVKNKIPIHDCYCCLVDKAGKQVQPHPVYLPNRLKALYNTDDFDLTWEEYVQNNSKEPKLGYYI